MKAFIVPSLLQLSNFKLKGMKTNLTLTLLLMLLLTGLSKAQDNEVKIEISRNVNGEKQTFTKTYDSEEAMKNDKELKEFMGDDNHVQFWFGSDNANIQAFNFEDLGQQMQNFSFRYGHEDEENGHSFMFLSDEDSAFSKQFSLQMKDMAKHLQLGVSTQLQDMQQNMIIDLQQNGSFVYNFGDSAEQFSSFQILKDNDEDGQQKVFCFRLSHSVSITDDTSEFGTKGSVPASKKLELNDLKYYPNPAPNGQFELRFDVEEPGELRISIYNMEGKEVFNRYFEQINGNYAETIDLSNQSEGIYLLEIEKDGKRLTRKIAIN